MPPVEALSSKARAHLESLKDPLEEDVVGVIDLRLLRHVLDLHLRLLVLVLLAALRLLLLRLLLLLLGSLLLAPLLAVSPSAIFLENQLLWLSTSSRERSQWK